MPDWSCMDISFQAVHCVESARLALISLKSSGSLKIGFWKMVLSAGFRGDISTLQSRALSLFSTEMIKGFMAASPLLDLSHEQASKSQKGHSHCFPGERGPEVSASLFKIFRIFAWLWFYQHIAVPLLLFISRKTKQNKNLGTIFPCLTKCPLAMRDVLCSDHARELTRTWYVLHPPLSGTYFSASEIPELWFFGRPSVWQGLLQTLMCQAAALREDTNALLGETCLQTRNFGSLLFAIPFIYRAAFFVPAFEKERCFA